MKNKIINLLLISFFAISFTMAVPAIAQDATEQPPAEQPPAEQPPAEQPPAEQPPAEQPPAEQPPAEQPPVEEKPIEPQPPAPPPVPEGCRQETDPATGAIRVICEEFRQACPSPPPGEESRCADEGGSPNYFVDPSGCKIFRCEFQKGAERGGFFTPGVCPSEEERARAFDKCEAVGGKPFIRSDQGCKVVDCAQSGPRGGYEDRCRMLPGPERERIERDCAATGGRSAPGFDDRGCPFPQCIREGEGRPGERPERGFGPPPKEAYEGCEGKGGEMVVKQDEEGNVVYARCVAPGDERDVEYEEIREVPSATKLLSIALKLENIKIEFDKLVKETSAIADYYASTGDRASEARFRKIASMFEGAKTRVDEIKIKMRDRLKELSKDDISEFLHDLKYVREVLMEDVLYVMLSTEGAEEFEERAIEEITTETKVEVREGVINCGRNGGCFDKAMRSCTPALFNPPDEIGGAERIDIEIKGIEGGNCVFTGKVIERGAVMADMVCRYPKYMFGVRGPEDIMPYCEGSMAEGFKQRGGRAGPPSGPPGEFEERERGGGPTASLTIEFEAAEGGIAESRGGIYILSGPVIAKLVDAPPGIGAWGIIEGMPGQNGENMIGIDASAKDGYAILFDASRLKKGISTITALGSERFGDEPSAVGIINVQIK